MPPFSPTNTGDAVRHGSTWRVLLARGRAVAAHDAHQPGYVACMTESPASQEGTGPPQEEGIDPAKVKEQVETDPETVPNAPNRAPNQSGESNLRDSERRAKPAPEAPIDRPGPLDPDESETDLPTGVESYERPGRDGNWERSEKT